MAHRAFRQEAGSEALAYGFAGEAFDTTTNLAYHRARWMDPRVGRFTGMDKMPSDDDETPISLHAYIYANDEPVALTDPTGTTALQGIIVHQRIGADFVSYGDYGRNGREPPPSILAPGTSGGQICRVSNLSFSTILGIVGLGRQRPDLTDRCRKEVWGIKQEGDEKSGLSDLIYYIAKFETLGEFYHPGASYDPIPTVDVLVAQKADVYVSQPGLIIYRLKDTDESNAIRQLVFGAIGVGLAGQGVMGGSTGFVGVP